MKPLRYGFTQPLQEIRLWSLLNSIWLRLQSSCKGFCIRFRLLKAGVGTNSYLSQSVFFHVFLVVNTSKLVAADMIAIESRICRNELVMASLVKI